MTDQSPDPNILNEFPKIVMSQPVNDQIPRRRKLRPILLRLIFVVLIFGAGFFSGIQASIYTQQGTNSTEIKTNLNMEKMVMAINPPQGFALPVKYGDVGPQLLSSGVIDQKGFEQLFEQSGQPLSQQELAILTKGSSEQVIINQENARFVLNFFWALGLVNKNSILDTGTIHTFSKGKIDGFASTGGWTLGQKPVTALFSSAEILAIDPDQQRRVDEVAKTVYRPCCDNPTDFPDCNHGMAMLGLLELMASQNASIDEMYTAAKNVNAFWFPQQTLEQATYFGASKNQDYPSIDARSIVGVSYSSISGFQQTHQWLAQHGLLYQEPKSGSNCGV
ncbi:MAG TPA: hypothetical protein VF313_09115 [Anaerolineaceae bacterium]